ncbi:PAS domain S-box protein [Brevundimonas sp. AJA228-03]|uniref:hybrid sensor histidine kinase/response regulator n=1 Tax=Brevundimonas sp. AJA228-03 TaxID=2752515 RepID=UPI001ADF826A|nr:ATP-binding protein [Brevundimonas sp. AJA228-03]QTN19660.1 PAS domain S-box protein [Brevundimonas sp. AJA228-03]
MHDDPDIEANAIGLTALKRSGVGWWRVLDASTTWWSPSMFDIFGLDPALGVPKPHEIFHLYHPDDTNIVARSWPKMFSSDEPFRMRYRVIRPTGECRHIVNWAQRQPPDEAGRRWVVGMVTDITDQVDDAALFDAERAFRFVAEHTSDMVVRSGLTSGITYASPASRSLLGYSPAEMVGMAPSDLVPRDHFVRIRAMLQDRIRRQELISPEGYEYQARHKDGRLVWLEANPRLVLNGAGELTEIVDVVRDIGSRKETEAALRAARAEAEAASQAKSEFLANMSHELRTPLTSILGFSRLIGASGDLSASDRGYLDLIRTAGETLLTVVNDILDFSKLEAGALTLDLEPFSAAALAEGATALLRDQAEAKGLVLTCETLCGGVAGDARLVGDVTRLRQVLLNLLSNAVKFTEKGSVRLILSIETDDEGTAVLSASVTDTGLGLAPDQIEQMFERFTQADGSVSRRFGGTGLGLAISRRLMDIMGGEIGARSDGKTGSTFWFRAALPFASADTTATTEADEGDLDRPLRILLAEDNAANRTLIKALLSSFDVSLDMVENGEEAVAAAAARPYDLILMDMQMPVMDGPTASRAIRASGVAGHDTPIVALTANVLPEQIRQCRDAGMQGHVAKPVDPRALMAALVEHARPRPAATEAADAA